MRNEDFKKIEEFEASVLSLKAASKLTDKEELELTQQQLMIKILNKILLEMKVR